MRIITGKTVKFTAVGLLAVLLFSGCSSEKQAEAEEAAPENIISDTKKVDAEVTASSQTGADIQLASELENYIAVNYGALNIALETEYEYYSNDIPQAEAWLPLDMGDDSSYQDVYASLRKAIDTAAGDHEKKPAGASGALTIILSFSYSRYGGELGYVVRLYCGTDDSKSDEIIRSVLTAPLSVWTDDEEHVLSDIFNDKNFYDAHWSTTESVEYSSEEYDWLVAYYGHIRSGAYKDMFVSFEALCGSSRERPVLIYFGYLSEDRTLADELFADPKENSDFQPLLNAVSQFVGLDG